MLFGPVVPDRMDPHDAAVDAELAFSAGSERDDHVKVAVLIGSLLAATLASVVLRIRNGVYRRIEEAETADDDADGVPDIYRSP
jgi:Na+:H+ antiporter, NhaA family